MKRNEKLSLEGVQGAPHLDAESSQKKKTKEPNESPAEKCMAVINELGPEFGHDVEQNCYVRLSTAHSGGLVSETNQLIRSFSFRNIVRRAYYAKHQSVLASRSDTRFGYHVV